MNLGADPSFWRGRSVFVTGCTGFVGSWLTLALLEAGARVVGLVRDLAHPSLLRMEGKLDRVTAVLGSVEDFPLLERALNEYEVDSCFHLAAQSIVGAAHRSPLSTFRSNIQGAWNLLEACRVTSGVERVVVASSDKAYGSHETLPYREDFELRGRHPYDASKSCADLLAQTYHHTYGLPLAIARCGNIFGGGDFNFNRIVPETMRAIIEGRPPVLRSDGTFVRDYFYVKDAVRSYLLLAQALDLEEVRGEAFNFGSEEPLSVLALVDRIAAVAGSPHLKPEVRAEARAEIKEQYLACGKARERLGWRAAWALDDGLRESYHWYRAFLGGGGLKG